MNYKTHVALASFFGATCSFVQNPQIPAQVLERWSKCRLLPRRSRRAEIKGLGQLKKTSPLPCTTGEIKRAELSASSIIKRGAGRRARSQSADSIKAAVERCDGEIIVCLAKSLSLCRRLTLFRSSISIFQFSPCSSAHPPAGPAAGSANLISRSANSRFFFSVCDPATAAWGQEDRTTEASVCVIYSTPSKRDESSHHRASINKFKLFPEGIT
jgi:hypothetical protein